MDIDWSVIKEWGIQVPALGIMLAFFVVALGSISAIVAYSYRANRVVATDFRETMSELVLGTQEHQREMRRLASEDSQRLTDVLEDHNRLIGRASAQLDWHERRQKEHEALIEKCYRNQTEVRSST